MKRLWTVFWYELRRNARRKGYLFGTFGVPLVGLVLVVGSQVLGGGSPQRTPFGPSFMNMPVDMDGIQSAGYVDEAGIIEDAGGLASVFTAYPDETAAQAALDAGEIEVYYVVAADYLESGQVTLVMPRLNFSHFDSDGIERLLLNALAQDVESSQVMERLVVPSRIDEVRTRPNATQSTPQTDEGAMVAVYAFAIVLLMSLFVTNGYLMQSVIEEKETRLIEILISSVRPLELLGGKILALGLLGLFQIVVWIAGIFLVARVGGADVIAGQALSLFVNFSVPPGLVALLLVYFVLAYLMFAAAFAIIGALSNSMREGPQYAAIFTLPAIVPVWFMQLVITQPNGALPVFLSLFPITAPLGMVERMAVTDVPAWQIIVSVGLLALTVAGVLWLAGRLFRVQTLLAGQVPRLRDIPRLVRG